MIHADAEENVLGYSSLYNKDTDTILDTKVNLINDPKVSPKITVKSRCTKKTIQAEQLTSLTKLYSL